MKLFSVQKEKLHITRLLPLLLLIVVLVVFAKSASAINESNSSKGKEILSNALDRSITQCYALEGIYPPSLDYLKENYGLTYDSERYFIDYQYIGSNLRPDTTIIEREAK